MISKYLLRFFSRLKFPWLFAAFAVLLGIDLVTPDPILFVDELLLGVSTLLLGAWKSRKAEAKPEEDNERRTSNIERPTSN